MTQQNSLDLLGNFQTHPFAELLAELSTANLTGSLRVSNQDQKAVVYFTEGSLIFAVSNARRFRLFDILLRENKIDKSIFADSPNFPNDIEFSEHLIRAGIMNSEEIDAVFAVQIDGILREVLAWKTGEWIFSPLARLRSGLQFPVDLASILFEHAQTIEEAEAAGRFRSLSEAFGYCQTAPLHALQPHEAFLLSRFTDVPLKISDVVAISGLSEAQTLKTLYSLWLGGLLIRKDWNSAFSDLKIATIRSANLKLTKQAEQIRIPEKIEPQITETIEEAEEKPPEVAPVTLDEYLDRVEKADTLYEILGIDPKTKVDDIRAAYFSLAKMFHPDRFHRAEASVLRRVENAFTKLAQAHETLRNPKTRHKYDDQMVRDMTDKRTGKDPAAAAENVSPTQLNSERAGQEFEHGRGLLLDDDAEAALPFLARAVHFAPENARYHAFYGKALSSGEGQNRHKAESEMQTAIRIEPNNASFRLMLAEFFVNVKLTKRAEGELNRLLAIAPDHKEARSLLDSLGLK